MPYLGFLAYNDDILAVGLSKKFIRINTCDIPIDMMTNVCITDHHKTRSFNSSAYRRPNASC